MSETLGSLCDKLTIVKLKQFHSNDKNKLNSLSIQEKQLSEEIDSFVKQAISGEIPIERLSFSSNKVFKQDGNETRAFNAEIGETFAELANVNCELWHEQEKVYDFEKVPMEEKDKVVKRLAVLNLERNKCIDNIDKKFTYKITQEDS